MTSDAKKILDDALALPAEERAALISALGANLEPGQLSAEWRAVIDARIDAVERSESEHIRGDDVASRARAKLQMP